MEVSRFHEILGRSQVDGDVRRDWCELETRSGLALPGDYKRFVTAYGPGCINDQLYLFHPRANEIDGLHLESLWSQASYAYLELSRNSPEAYPYAVHPAAGGCVAVARSTSGNYVFLVPSGSDLKDWSILIDLGQWVELKMTFTDFLWAALHGELEVPIIEGEPMFERVGEVE